MTKLIFLIDNADDKQLMLALGRRLNLSVEELDANELSDAEFWGIIESIKFEDQEANLEEATKALAGKSETEIRSFADLLAEKLFELDKREYAEKLTDGNSEKHFSPDHFLDLRAFVVAKGKTFYESTLHSSSDRVEVGICEELISLPTKAWKLKTGLKFDYLPNKNYFTYSNPEGWEVTFLDQLLKKQS